MKLEVGMFVRFKTLSNEFKIGQIQLIDNIIYELDNNEVTADKYIIKASHNIIDLIEENDIVVIRRNGDLYKYEVFSVPIFSDQKFYVYENMLGETTMLFLEDIPKEYIVSIVTKEQFEQMQYKVDN